MNYIIFGFEHYNPLGIARSLGESGIKPIVIADGRDQNYMWTRFGETFVNILAKKEMSGL